ncbi:helix-turn-helix domain-containing protein [Mucilaginibacter myungsuensis]|uniref:Helix-turn-helix transcriptional regulator n=1 Tax=Mucilaginibacter myungsuensis TaxID=649104 RepID=A0A929L6D7_9SPHI|nr:response regulator transcription factor [Mucilaginibacter myungsuensis]MBE9664036.1 helix-turn-helix transcriptional regulator [Mucilaginibacter myungsuensis]MDN3601215.1 helix-turn-helix transcriptional regulator [Mucilaginibacter myungsuensis]
MKTTQTDPIMIRSITDFCDLLGHPKPEHPLLTMVELTCGANYPELPGNKLIYDFYTVFIKRNVKGVMKYGQKEYDFKEGVMGFSAPKQVFMIDGLDPSTEITGWFLAFHPDLIRKYDLGKKIKDYNFFSYSVNEALHLSDKEERMIEKMMRDIRTEYQQPIDAFSQDVMVSQLDLLLTYCNRFYNRQFITRRNAEESLLNKFTDVVSAYFEQEHIDELPNVNDISAQLNVSPHYLSDMLRTLTGQSAQQHIHGHLIEKAKELLLTTNLSVNETAYRLGFEYPQYFNRLFKNKTGVTPAAFRNN